MVWTLFLGLAATGGADADVPGRYVWPLAGHTNISAGFCDWRPQHYHGGIDLSTDGREGIDVRAADSGWVMRVSTSYWGFGKAVYLRMSDGRIAVYGHLSDFAPAIRKFVEKKQYASRRYRQNLFPAPGEIPIRRGEIIAKTGQTGAGPPHLHFEIRTSSNRPLNPLVVGFDKPDRTPPLIKAVTFIPRPPDDRTIPPTTINGSLKPVTIAVEKAAGKSGLAETPVVSGAVGLAVLATDHVNGRKWTMSPYKLRLLANDRLVAELSFDSINYAHTRLIDLERRFDPKPGIRPRAINLFRTPRNVLWHFRTLVDDGWLIPGEVLVRGANVIRLEIEDAAGNRTDMEFGLMLAPGGFPGDPQGSSAAASAFACEPGDGGLIVRVPAGGARDLRCYNSVASQTPYRGVRQGDSYAFVLPAAAVGDTVWTGVPGGAREPHALPWQAVQREDGAVVTSEDGLAELEIGPDDLYRSTFVTLRRIPSPEKGRRLVSGLYEFASADPALARDVRLAISYAGRALNPDRLALYRRGRSGRGWSFEGAAHKTGREMIAAKIRTPGSFALLDDQTPPVIEQVRPGRGKTITNRRPTIRFRLHDALAGIGSDEDVVLTIGGQWVPVEYDPEQRTAKARPRWNLTPGKHRVEIVARDRVGNEETFLRILNVR